MKNSNKLKHNKMKIFAEQFQTFDIDGEAPFHIKENGIYLDLEIWATSQEQAVKKCIKHFQKI